MAPNVPSKTGFATGADYGLGLFRSPIRIPIEGSSSDCVGFEDICKCHLLTGCWYDDVQIGHPGLDYGSGFPFLGFHTGLNASVVLASNTGENVMGMNYSMGTLENYGFTNAVECRFVEIAVQLARPGFPPLKCQ